MNRAAIEADLEAALRYDRLAQRAETPASRKLWEQRAKQSRAAARVKGWLEPEDATEEEGPVNE